MTYSENQTDKQDAVEVKNYTRTPNMLIFGYQNISPQEKWLYVCLKHMCGRRGIVHLTAESENGTSRIPGEEVSRSIPILDVCGWQGNLPTSSEK